MAWSCSQFSEASDNSELRRSCDEVLARFREESHETAHSTPGISLLADGKCAERMSVRLSPIVDFASSSRVCPLLRALGLTRCDERALAPGRDALSGADQARLGFAPRFLGR